MSFGSNAIISKYIPDNNTYSQIGIFNNGNSQSIKVRGNLLNDDITITYDHITCSKGWGYSGITDMHTAFINSPSFIYTSKITPNATTTAWNTVTIPALKNFNKLYFVVKIGDYMVQNTFIDKRTNGNATTMTYSAYSGPGYFACILVSVHFNEGTVSVKWKNGAGWGPTQCDISELWIHPMDHAK